MSRRIPKFSTRTAEEDASRLDPGDSADPSHEGAGKLSSWWPNLGLQFSWKREREHSSLPLNFFPGISRWWGWGHNDGEQEESQDERPPHTAFNPGTLWESSLKDKAGYRRRSTDHNYKKLGTFSGVFVPTTLNVLSVLMFLRFSFILGQGGVLGILGLLVISYLINLVTSMSLSAIATNGTVRGGGAYYLISRSLGPEFGGSIGIVFYLGHVLNTGMNAVGLVDCFVQNFGVETGTSANFLEESFWWRYLWGTAILILCTGTSLAGSAIFARAGKGLLLVLLIAAFSIPLSAFVRKPFTDRDLGIEFTGASVRTFLENLKPKLSKGAAGSQLDGKETFQDLFGILFPATSGIFAGASMSGDLRNPSKSIPKGTLSGIALTFVTYTVVILAIAASISRQSLYRNANVIQVTNLSWPLILLGEFATSFFSSLMGVTGSSKLLQAIARDSLLPGLNAFGRGTRKNDEPIYAIMVTYVAAQITMLFDINQIASFVTMAYLMTFFAMNLACFLLKISSAPNFRPSFHYFNWKTAAAGALFSGVSMFFVDGVYATGCVAALLLLFLLIHYSSPPKAWGDVSQSLIYHQVRKYLLRLRQEHVKFWRPQILLFINSLDDQYKMVSFCNSLKKGGLFVLGHVLVTDDFTAAVPEARRQQSAWTKFVEYSRVKAFVNITVSPTPEWGIRNVVLNAGLGGMRPNIVVIDQFRKGQSIVEAWHPFADRRGSSGRHLSPPVCDENGGPETGAQDPLMSCKTYVTILEDLLFKLRMNVAVAKGFEDLELPDDGRRSQKKYIDLWPIQMSAELGADSESKQNVLTTNFDTYTMILQLGCILNTVPSWKKAYKIRVAVFVEYETDVEDERRRVEALLEKLRMEAEVVVFWLACGDLKAYRIIVNGDMSPETADAQESVSSVLNDEDWWQDMQRSRANSRDARGVGTANKDARPDRALQQSSANQGSGQSPIANRGEGWKKLMQSLKRRQSLSSHRTLGGVSLGMQTHRLLDTLDTLVDYDVNDNMSDTSDDSDLEPYISGDDGEDDGKAARVDDATSEPDSKAKDQILQASGRPGEEVDNGAAVSIGSETSSSPGAPAVDASKLSVPSTGVAGNEFSPKSTAHPVRPPFHRSPSSKRFSSAPIPEPRVNTEEGAGPSIMFADHSSPTRAPNRRDSMYNRRPSLGIPGSRPSASGYPGQASLPLSFNDLPSRAQHLILNELMAQQSDETAVIFTTLPSPFEATSQSEEASQTYLNDLDVLWQGLPPCLLVHSNSMTVTMNL